MDKRKDPLREDARGWRTGDEFGVKPRVRHEGARLMVSLAAGIVEKFDQMREAVRGMLYRTDDRYAHEREEVWTDPQGEKRVLQRRRWKQFSNAKLVEILMDHWAACPPSEEWIAKWKSSIPYPGTGIPWGVASRHDRIPQPDRPRSSGDRDSPSPQDPSQEA